MRANNHKSNSKDKAATPARRQLITAQLVPATSAQLNAHLRWQRQHVCKSLRTAKGSLAAECLCVYLPLVLSADKRRHLARVEANQAE